MATSPDTGDRTAAPAPAGDAVNAYDAIPYSVAAYPQTRPDRLAAIAALFGLDAPPPGRCRVLELGCASGGNVIPLALSSPDSTFLGIDLSARQIAEGQAVVRELGLGNAVLQQGSILDVNEDFGTFDYILAHGVYSWVPPDVQDKILDICRRNLAPNGVAYVSYNTLPGWHARGAIREMLWYHTDSLTDPAERIRAARELLTFLAESAPASNGGYGMLLREELDVLADTPDSYVIHEHLEDCNDPVYFHQFAERAAAKGLQYLGEAHIGIMVAARFGAEAERTLRRISPDLLHMEQYMDFLRNRMFRQTLFCHGSVPLDHALRPEAVQSFFIAAPLQPVSANPEVASSRAEEFRGAGGTTLTTADPLMKAALAHLSRIWPLSVPFAKLFAAAHAEVADALPTAEAARTLAGRLLHAHTSGLIEFTLADPRFVVEVSARPAASPYARLCARDGGQVINLRLEAVPMGAPSRLVLRHLDGSHDRAALIALLTDWLDNASPTPVSAAVPAKNSAERAARFVDQALDGYARSALLVG